MRNLEIDSKWSVKYDPENNDQPVCVLRYGKEMPIDDWKNDSFAMFYALLAFNGVE